MKKLLAALLIVVPLSLSAQLNTEKPQAVTASGTIEGISRSGICVFKGIPYAAPPTGELRWKEPQPVKSWEGVRKADHFGPRAMQKPIFSDMQFRSDGVSEDCLYLNIWTPARSADEKLPVLVYFYGGGFMAGDGSEHRYDGESMARKGIVAITVNYRLGIFGFFAHPELSRETLYKGSGNYGLMDQWAALRWVRQNIAAFGGDPARVTIAGESAGSISVSALMASPKSKGLIAGAICESGTIIKPTLPPVPLTEAEKQGTDFAVLIGAKSLADLRAVPAEKLLDLSFGRQGIRTAATIDGYFFPKLPADIFASGEQAKVPLLLGWNSEESGSQSILGPLEPSPENYTTVIKNLFRDSAASVLKLYPGTTADEVIASSTDLAGDRFISFSTWKLYDLHRQTGNSKVYRYFYARPRPLMRSDAGNPEAKVSTGASHSSEIEYAMGNLPTNRVYDWQPEDFTVSAIMQEYFANFVKTGDPNGTGLPLWPVAGTDHPEQYLIIDVNTRAVKDQYRKRYEWLDQWYKLNEN